MSHMQEILKSEAVFQILQRNIKLNNSQCLLDSTQKYIRLISKRLVTPSPEAILEQFADETKATLVPFINPTHHKNLTALLHDKEVVKVLEEMTIEGLNVLAFIDCLFTPYENMLPTIMEEKDEAMEVTDYSESINNNNASIGDTPRIQIDTFKKSLAPRQLLINSTRISDTPATSNTPAVLQNLITEFSPIDLSTQTTSNYQAPSTNTNFSSNGSSIYYTPNTQLNYPQAEKKNLFSSNTITSTTYAPQYTGQLPPPRTTFEQSIPTAASTFLPATNINPPKSDLYRSFLPESIYKDYSAPKLKPMNLRDAVEYVPTWDGNRKELNRFITGCFNAKRVVPPSHESALAQAIQNKLQGGAAIASSNTKFENVAQVVDFFEARFSHPKDYLGLQGELNSIRQKVGEAAIDYSNRIRELSSDILRAARRENRLTDELLTQLRKDLAKYFRRGLHADIKVLVPHSEDFEETLTNALEAEREAGMPTSISSPVIHNAQIKLINTSETICQICRKSGHEARECWQFKRNINQGNPQGQNKESTAIPRRDPNIFCRYCKKPGHIINTCWKRERLYGKYIENTVPRRENINQLPAAYYERDTITHNNHPLNREPVPQQYSIPLPRYMENNERPTFAQAIQQNINTPTLPRQKN